MKNFKYFCGFALITGVAATSVFAQNYKIKQSISMNGQNMSSTVFVKGSRKRTESSGMMGMGGDVASIEQCDLKRTIQVSDKKMQYSVEPFASDIGDTPAAGAKNSGGKNVKATKGGTITMTSAITDTGERKQMFGLTARHVKTVMSSQSSPDACSKNDMRIETDGWYIDLPAFSCPISAPKNPMAAMNEEVRGCQDRTVFKQTGSGKLGFALSMTQTMKSGSDEDAMSFSQTLETLEFSKATLEDSLFNVPAGYTLVNSSQSLYGQPDSSQRSRASQMSDDEDTPKPETTRSGTSSMVKLSTPGVKKAGVKRIGVLAPTNRAGENISLANMQSYLVQKLTSGNVDAVAVGSEADVRAAGCDFILSSDFSKLKQSTASKIGGMFGKITNSDTSAAKNYDAQVDFKLMSLGTGQQITQNKAASKTESDLDRAAQGVLAAEANAILAAIR